MRTFSSVFSGSGTSRFRECLHDSSLNPVIYEIIPPPVETTAEEIEATLQALLQLMKELSHPPVALNIPEIRPETRDTPRPQNYQPKLSPRDFVRYLQPFLESEVDIIINRVVVHSPRPSQLRWFYRTYHEYGVKNFVLVGGESSRIRYPGPTVTECARLVRDHLNRGQWPYGPGIEIIPTQIMTGGIVIPSRRSNDPVRDEPNRLIDKTRNGVSFFTSQVLYEAESTIRLLSDYAALCDKFQERPRPIFLSFAPVSSSRDIQFLKWLGVEIPDSIEREMLTGWLGITMRSIRIAERILEEILEFVEGNQIQVPLGLNIEHVTSRNFEASGEMMDRLGGVLRKFMQNRVGFWEDEAEIAFQVAGLDPNDSL